MLSAKVLGEKFNLKESTLGKLLNAQCYLGRKEAMLYKRCRDSVEEEESETKPDSSSKVMDHDKL